jgi:hypothetical protein
MTGIIWRFHLWTGSLPANSLRANCDSERAFGSFLEEWAFEFLIVSRAISVGELHLSGAKNFEAVMKISPRSEGLSSKAGAGVVDFEQKQGLICVIAHGGFDVRRATARDGKD